MHIYFTINYHSLLPGRPNMILTLGLLSLRPPFDNPTINFRTVAESSQFHSSLLATHSLADLTKP